MNGDRLNSRFLSRCLQGLVVALALAVGPVAQAGAPSFVDEVGSVASVELAATTEVTLYQNPDAAAVPLVSVVVNGKTDKPQVMMAIDSRSSLITVNDAFVKLYGLEKKTTNKKLINKSAIRRHRAATAEDYEAAKYKLGGEITYVEIESLQIGDLKLSGVKALVSSAKADFGGGVVKSAPQLGMGALPGVAYAIKPSTGKVAFAPAAQGAALLATVKGTPVPYTSTPWDEVKFGLKPGKKWCALKKVSPLRTAIVDAKVGGQDVKAALNTAGGGSVSSVIPVKSDVVFKTGDATELFLDETVGGQSLGQTAISVTGSYEMGALVGHKATISGELLAAHDLVVDPGTSTLVIAKASANQRVDIRAGNLEAAKTLLAAAEKAAAEAAAKDGKPAKPSVAEMGALAAAHAALGQTAEQLALLEKIAAADDKDCSAKIDLGTAQLSQGKISEAIASLSAASALYHGWWDRSLDVRKELGKHLDKAEEGETVTDADGKPVVRVPGACHTADASLALAYVAAKDFAKAEAVYRANLDLDAGLARAWGAGALISGDAAKAAEAYRQAILRDQAPEVASQIGLALAVQAGGDAATAAGLFGKALATDREDFMSGALWLDGLRATQGAPASLAAARDWLKANPSNLVAATLFLREARAANDAGAAAQATRASAQAVEDLKRRQGNVVGSEALVALSALYAGDLDAGQKAADEAVKADAGNALAWFALAEALSAKGVETRAADARKKAALLGGAHPGYALLLK